MACTGQSLNGRDISARTLVAGPQCGRTGAASIVEIDSPEAMQARLPGPPASPAAFERERIFIIDMGSRPTAGYGLSLTRASHEHGRATVMLEWQTPAPGARVAQMLTSPCLAIALERGAYSEVRVVDQDNVERARLTLR